MTAAVTITPAEAAGVEELEAAGVKFLTIEQLVRFLAISESSVDELIRSKQIPSIKLGRLRRIPIAGYKAFIAAKLKQNYSACLEFSNSGNSEL